MSLINAQLARSNYYLSFSSNPKNNFTTSCVFSVSNPVHTFSPTENLLRIGSRLLVLDRMGDEVKLKKS